MPVDDAARFREEDQECREQSAKTISQLDKENLRRTPRSDGGYLRTARSCPGERLPNS